MLIPHKPLSALALILFSQTTFAQTTPRPAHEGGGGPGNGGDPMAAQFADVAAEVLDFLIANPNVTPSVQRDRLEVAIGSTAIDMQNCQQLRCRAPVPGPAGETLYVRGVACNYPEQRRIEVCRGPGWASKSRTDRRRIAIHEYLGMMEIPDPAYVLTRRIVTAMARSERGAFPLVDAPNLRTSSMRSAPGAEGDTHGTSIEVGAGAGIALGTTPGSMEISPTGGARGGIRAFANSCEQRAGNTPVYPNCFGVTGELRAALGAAANRPLYSTRLDATAAWTALGVWVAVEANQFQHIAERYARAMGTLFSYGIRLQGEDYVLVRVAPFGAFLGEAQLNRPGSPQTGNSGYSGALDVIARAGRFFVEIRGNVDHHIAINETRISAEGAIGAVLGFIFPNDEIRIEGRYVRYTGHSVSLEGGSSSTTERLPGAPAVESTTVGAYYQVRF